MPTIDTIGGIKINIYNGDHRPPHIHAVYNEYEVLVEIETKETYAGWVPAKQHRKVLKWLAGNEKWALTVFYEMNPHLR